METRSRKRRKTDWLDYWTTTFDPYIAIKDLQHLIGQYDVRYTLKQYPREIPLSIRPWEFLDVIVEEKASLEWIHTYVREMIFKVYNAVTSQCAYEAASTEEVPLNKDLHRKLRDLGERLRVYTPNTCLHFRCHVPVMHHFDTNKIVHELIIQFDRRKSLSMKVNTHNWSCVYVRVLLNWLSPRRT